MKKSCRYCGRYHDTSVICAAKPKRTKHGTSKAEKFRRLAAWKTKSIEIRERDRGLCQYCIRLVPSRYTFQGLEVHHIVKLDSDLSRGLDNMNLLSLCKEHHILADAYEIGQDVLHGYAKEQEQKRL